MGGEGSLPNIVDLQSLDRDRIDGILDRAEDLPPPLTSGRSPFAVMFFAEPSTRTRISFGSALAASGVAFDALGLEDCKISTGESLDDTLRVFQRTADLLII